jgi:hypothetical protein
MKFKVFFSFEVFKILITPSNLHCFLLIFGHVTVALPAAVFFSTYLGLNFPFNSLWPVKCVQLFASFLCSEVPQLEQDFSVFQKS